MDKQRRQRPTVGEHRALVTNSARSVARRSRAAHDCRPTLACSDCCPTLACSARPARPSRGACVQRTIVARRSCAAHMRRLMLSPAKMRKADATRAGEIAQRHTCVRQPDDERRRESRTRTPCATGSARRTRRSARNSARGVRRRCQARARYAEALRGRPCVASGDARLTDKQAEHAHGAWPQTVPRQRRSDVPVWPVSARGAVSAQRPHRHAWMHLIHERLPVVPWDGCGYPAARSAPTCRGTPHASVLPHLLSSSADARDHRDSNDNHEHCTGSPGCVAHLMGTVHRCAVRTGHCGYCGQRKTVRTFPYRPSALADLPYLLVVDSLRRRRTGA